MDELELLTLARPDPRPTPEITEQHREQLRAAIAEEQQQSPTRLLVTRRWQRAALVAAAVLVAAAGLVLLTRGTNSAEHRNVTATNPPTTAPAPSVPAAALTCGTQLPDELAVPAGYDGPVSGPALEAEDSAESGQFVQHWTSGANSFEMRWPADTDKSAMFAKPSSSPGISAAHSLLQHTAAGQPFQRVLYSFGAQPNLLCHALQVTFYGADDDAVGTAMSTFSTRPFVFPDIPLVTQSTSVDALPAAGACPTPPGVTSPNRGGLVEDGPTFATPRAALEAFVEQPETASQSGYTEMQLPDGSLGYAFPSPLEGDDAYVTVIHVRHDPDGWRVDSWDASGC